jgi:shikimate kinase
MKVNRIILVGPMGAGKSTVGLQLANWLNFEFVDSDYVIMQKHSASMTQIINSYGEAYFRNQETQVLKSNLHKSNIVFATGGGGILKAENRAIMKANFWACYLKVSPYVQSRRLHDALDRPLLPNDPMLRYEYLLNMQQQRSAWYTAVAKTIIVTDDKSVVEVAKQVYAALQEPVCTD